MLPISVVIPAYNAGKYIQATLASVHEQTSRASEIIVVDDGSTDDTVEIARRCGARVMEQRNLGVSVARNRGIEAAANSWIALLDADDLWLPDKLERQWFAASVAPQVSFVFSDFSQFDEIRVRNKSVLHEIHRQFARVALTPLGNDAFVCDSPTLNAALLVQNVIQPSALLIRRDVVLELSGFDPLLLACQDYEFVLRLLRQHTGAYVDSPLVRYRRHAKATTSNIPKSREGLANVALRAITQPAAHTALSVKHFREALPDLLVKCGFAHLRYGSARQARRWLSRSLHERFTLPAAVLYPLTFFTETRLGRQALKFALEASARGSD